MARSSGSQGFEEKRFDVVVELSSTDANLRPEMTARADILVEELNDVLLAPVNAVFEREGGFVAHVLTPWGTRTTTVELGASDGTEVEIRAGLREGDRLHLEDLAAASPHEGAPSTAPSRAPGGQEFAPR
jgi:multidrug efflux pump subunit AcrA (membrane-fusion protein)